MDFFVIVKLLTEILYFLQLETDDFWKVFILINKSELFRFRFVKDEIDGMCKFEVYHEEAVWTYFQYVFLIT